MTEEAAQRGELRELLFDGVAPPAGGDAMFGRTFAATGDDGAHLLPPDNLFDESVADDPLPVADAPVDLFGDGPAVDDGDDAPPDAGADPAADWAGPHDTPHDTIHGADDTGAAGAVHPDW